MPSAAGPDLKKCGTRTAVSPAPVPPPRPLLSRPTHPLPTAPPRSVGRYMDKKLSIKLNGNRHVNGVLRGFDQFMNLVIDEAVEQALPRPHLARALPASTSCKHAHARARSGTFARCVRSAWCGEWQERDASRPAGGGGGWGGAVLGE